VLGGDVGGRTVGEEKEKGKKMMDPRLETVGIIFYNSLL